MSRLLKKYKKLAKSIDREIKEIRTILKKAELEGCYSDREYDQKEKKLEEIKSKIAELENEKDRIWRSLATGKDDTPEED